MSKKETSKSTRQQRDSSPREKPLKRHKSEEPVPEVPSSSSALVSAIILSDNFLMDADESKKYKPGELHQLFIDEIAKFRESIDKFILKSIKREKTSCDVFIQQAAFHVMQLRTFNRLDKHRLKDSRDRVNENKLKIDEMHLKLQNLLYEISHLKKEAKKCLEFRSQDEEVDLISIEDFFGTATKDISKPEITKKDPHQLTLARLNFELEQRKRLSLKLKDAEIKKKIMKNKIKDMKEKFCSVLPILEGILEKTRDLQEMVLIEPSSKINSELTKFLPKPLLFLYQNAVAYAEVYDMSIDVSINEGMDEKCFKLCRNFDVDMENSDSDDLDNEHHWPVLRRNENNVLKKHKLSIKIVIPYEDSQVSLIFSYLENLNVVTVFVDDIDVDLHPSQKISNVFEPEFFLDSLFPGDYGGCIPKQNIISQLLNSNEKSVPFSKIGLPYKWAQQFAGLSYKLKSTEKEPTDNEIADCIVNIFSTIRSRLKARISLVLQIEILIHRRRPVTELAYLFPTNVISQLKNLRESNNKELFEHPNYDELIKMDVFKEESIMFKAIIERGSAVLTAVIGIPLNYPMTYPTFVLFLHWRVPCTSATDIALRQMEEYINIHFVNQLSEQHKFNILSCQLYHLLSCLDIYVETDHSDDFIEGPREFARDKVVTKMQRARDHLRPYKYLPEERIFTAH